MSRYIDIEYLKKKKHFLTAQQRYIVRMTDIYNAPSIDIVRCKECKHIYTMDCAFYEVGDNVKPDDFCSYGQTERSSE